MTASVFALATQTASVTSSGSCNFGAINEWAAQVVTAGAPTTRLLTWQTSVDGVTYSQVCPSETAGSWLNFETPAQYVIANFIGNTGLLTINVVANPSG
jgi:hypothetical protein